MALIDGESVSVVSFGREAYREILKSVCGKSAICCLEQVGAMPGQGVTSMFSFGENYGYVRGLLEAYEIPYQIVRPQTWKKEFSLNSEKNRSIEVCKRLFPNLSLLPTEKSRKDSDGMAEATLMALYAKRNF